MDLRRSELVNENALNLNALNLNALNLNALNLNALNLNALNLNALNLNAMDARALTALASPGVDGEFAREVVRYLAGCALRPDQAVELRWTDQAGEARSDAAPGVLGLAPEWASGALDEAGQEWVSACLASRSNFSGAPVMISSRGAHPALKRRPGAAGEEEWETFQILEGSFWGNLFGEAPYLRSCFHGPGIEPSRDRERECAAGHLQPDGTVVACGPIERVGECGRDGGAAGACRTFNRGDYFRGCERPDGSRSSRVITTWLQ